MDKIEKSILIKSFKSMQDKNGVEQLGDDDLEYIMYHAIIELYKRGMAHYKLLQILKRATN